MVVTRQKGVSNSGYERDFTEHVKLIIDTEPNSILAQLTTTRARLVAIRDNFPNLFTEIRSSWVEASRPVTDERVVKNALEFLFLSKDWKTARFLLHEAIEKFPNDGELWEKLRRLPDN